ncbi:RAMP superfamily CRISPR-associated protein [Paenibacillus sp. FSL H8-0104]|uniref:RAMP superfamily CRISPR-associated protein n=1 Tax=Paenibacillus sp. FSL H8-0104 TaxID=2954509 RepID=UPI0030FD3115
MNIRQSFTFTLRAKTPVHFGGDSPGKLLLDGDDKPFVSGNSIGGALRGWLKDGSKLLPADVNHYLGGSAEETEEFLESRVFISDGYLKLPNNPSGVAQSNGGFLVMEGTAVDPKTGSARIKHKYKRDDLPKGTELVFTVECDTQTEAMKSPEGTVMSDAMQEPISFQKLMYTCAVAIHKGKLRFGGKKSNGHGCFSLQQLTCREFTFNSFAALDQFIFNRDIVEEKDCTEDALEYEEHVSVHPTTVLYLKGRFPYGVYQSYTDQKRDDKQTAQITGLLREEDNQYYLPGSSIKGLLRHEMRRLLFRMLQDQERSAEIEARVDTLLQEWFGSQDKMGSVVVADVVINQTHERNNNSNSKSIYNRIDRITGGVIDGALKTQNEVRGTAKIHLELKASKDAENKLFPLLYLLRSIGSGLLPLGGRTVIGLGEFEAKETVVHHKGDILKFSNTCPLSEDSQTNLEKYYNLFVGFLNKEGEV